MGTFFLAYIIAVVTDQLREYVADPFNTAMDNVMKFTRFHAIPREGNDSLGERIKEFYTSFYASRSMVDDKEIVGKLTPSLRHEVMNQLLANSVHLCPLLQEGSSFRGRKRRSRRDQDDTLRAERRLEGHRKFEEAIYWRMMPVRTDRPLPSSLLPPPTPISHHPPPTANLPPPTSHRPPPTAHTSCFLVGLRRCPGRWFTGAERPSFQR